MRSLPGDIDGGVIYLNFVNAFINQCTFENNSANFTSGAIYITDGGLYVTNSYIFNNTAIQSEGGAIYSISGSISIEDIAILPTTVDTMVVLSTFLEKITPSSLDDVTL